MDIQMPVMDGFAAMKILKRTLKTKDIKTVAFTAFVMKTEAEKILQAGLLI